MRLHSEVRSHGEGHAPASRARLGESHLLGAAALSRQLESLPGGMCIGLRPRMQQRENHARACGFERDGERSDFGWRDVILPSGQTTYRPRGLTPRRKNALLVDFAGAAESAGSGERRRVKVGKSVVTAHLSERRCSAQAVDRREDGWRVQRLAAAVKLCSGAEGQGRQVVEGTRSSRRQLKVRKTSRLLLVLCGANSEEGELNQYGSTHYSASSESRRTT
jgi:hypothetical protein